MATAWKVILVSIAGRKYPPEGPSVLRQRGALKIRVSTEYRLGQLLWLSRPMRVEDTLAPHENVYLGGLSQTIRGPDVELPSLLIFLPRLDDYPLSSPLGSEQAW